MSAIKIKHFGPIKEGYQEDDGLLDVKKVTVFIGNQGSGKSTVAKVLSTLTWLEKAINRGDHSANMNANDFWNYFDYQNLRGYFKPNTIIEYKGDLIDIEYNPSKYPNNPSPKIQKSDGKYVVPKIMYVPTERNFLTVIKNASNVKGLPEPLFEFAEELKLCQNEFTEKEILLPVTEEVFYKYDANTESSYLIGDDFNVNLLVASSGFQSLVPLFLVSFSLAKNIHAGSEINPRNISVNQNNRIKNEIGEIMIGNGLTDAEKIEQVNAVKARFQNKAFINIVEEPELSLFPSSQHQLLNSLLQFNNKNEGNKLVITTHSPYLINFLTLAVKADEIFNILIKKEYKFSDPEFGYINDIVPMSSTINSSDLAIYELDETDGSIKKLGSYKGLPSDENKLNYSLEDSNELFAQLLEIQQGI